MSHKNILVQKLQHQISRHDFNSAVAGVKQRGTPRVFNHRNHFFFMIFCLINNVKSLRQGIRALNSHLDRFYHIGLSKILSLSTVSEANTNRNSEAYERLFKILLSNLSGKKRRKLKKKMGACQILDSTCMTLRNFDSAWGEYHNNSKGVKLHLRIDQKTCVPDEAVITSSREADINVAKEMNFEAGNTYVMDRAYFDTEWLYSLNTRNIFFVIRMKRNTVYKTLSETKIDKANVVSESCIHFMGACSQKYQEHLRLITIYDKRKQETFNIITNDFTKDALLIAEIYKKRWQIEILFKFIKQNLKFKTFLGRSENAIKTQIWIALILYVLLWKMYQQETYYHNSLLEYIVYFRERMLLPDPDIKFRNKPPPDLQIKLFDFGEKCA